MLVDPFTIAAAAPIPQLTMSIVKSDGYGSERVDTGGSGMTLMVSHTPSKGNAGNRHYLNLRWTKDATNPYSGLVQKQSASVSLSISRPVFGFTDTEMVDLVEALRDTLFDSEVTPLRILQFQA
jgi:hypothetical protein